jgi:hypothetical protein
MSIEVDVLIEMWTTCKEYISPKDRQAAADHVINVVADHDVTDSDMAALASTDSYLRHAVCEYLGEDLDDSHAYDDDNEDDD